MVSLQLHIASIREIKRSFTKDCYFYYVVPDKDLMFIANFFDDKNWKHYAALTTKEKIAFRKNMCRTEDDDMDMYVEHLKVPEPPAGSEVIEDDIIGWNAVMSPWADCKFRTVKDAFPITEHQMTIVVIFFLFVILISL